MLTLGLSDSPGVPATTAAATLTAKYNDLDSVKALIEANKVRAGLCAVAVGAPAGASPPTEPCPMRPQLARPAALTAHQRPNHLPCRARLRA